MNQNNNKKALVIKLVQNLCKIIVFFLVKKNINPYAIFHNFNIAHSFFTLKMLNNFGCVILLSTIFFTYSW